MVYAFVAQATRAEIPDDSGSRCTRTRNRELGPNKYNFDDDVLSDHVATGPDVAAGRSDIQLSVSLHPRSEIAVRSCSRISA